MKIKNFLLLIFVVLIGLLFFGCPEPGSSGGSSSGGGGSNNILNTSYKWKIYNTNGTSGIDKPLARINLRMAYAGNNNLILFGGGTSTLITYGDTWEYNAVTHTWTQFNTGGTTGVNKPEGKSNHAMAYAGDSNIILFGGQFGFIVDETWEYNALSHTWTQYNTGGTAGVDKPLGRVNHAMAYAGGSKLILFGGYRPSTTISTLCDTWEYDVSTHTWTQYNTGGTPGVDKPINRQYHSMAYVCDSKIILFGGSDNNGDDLGDTWEYDLSTHTWMQYNTGGIPGTDKPIARNNHAMAYVGSTKLILFGGNNLEVSDQLQDTWEYDISNHIWTQKNTGGITGVDKPSKRYKHAMTYIGSSKLILFGGADGVELDETWEYQR